MSEEDGGKEQRKAMSQSYRKKNVYLSDRIGDSKINVSCSYAALFLVFVISSVIGAAVRNFLIFWKLKVASKWGFLLLFIKKKKKKKGLIVMNKLLTDFDEVIKYKNAF